MPCLPGAFARTLILGNGFANPGENKPCIVTLHLLMGLSGMAYLEVGKKMGHFSDPSPARQLCISSKGKKILGGK